MKVYVHNDRTQPTLIVPLTEQLFLCWVQRKEMPNPEWSLKHVGYVHSLNQKAKGDIVRFCQNSKMVTEATPLEVLLYTGNSIEQVRETYQRHLKALGLTE